MISEIPVMGGHLCWVRPVMGETPVMGVTPVMGGHLRWVKTPVMSEHL